MSAPSAEPTGFAEVETTNFNAVKALILKYGIALDPAITQDEAEQTEDLGYGSPFSITAEKLPTGKTVWRFQRRSAAEWPRSSSEQTLGYGHGASASTSSISSTSQFEDRDGYPLQGGDMLGAVLGEHPCFPSLFHPENAPDNAGESVSTSAPHRSPFGPSIKFTPLSSRTRTHLTSAARLGSSEDPELDGLDIFDLLQGSLPPASPTPESVAQGWSYLPETPAPERRQEDNVQTILPPSWADHPQIAVWGAPAPEARSRRDVVQVAGRMDELAHGSGLPSQWRPPPKDDKEASDGVVTDDSDPFPPLREYQHTALFPKGRSALLAASLERLVVELTTYIDSRLQVDFFYSFRTFMSTHELLHLLLRRLEWAITSSLIGQDAQSRDVVRVRTYVVIKFWLCHFFEEDFLPDRALRSTLTGWLNRHKDLQAMDNSTAGVILNLRKTVLRVKRLYSKAGPAGILKTDPSGFDGDTSIESIGSTSFVSVDSSNLELDFSEQVDTPGKKGHSQSFGAPTRSSVTGRQDAMTKSLASPVSPKSGLSKALNTTVNRLHKLKFGGQRKSVEAGAQGDSPETTNIALTEDLLYAKGGLESFLEFFNLPKGDEARSTASAVSDATVGSATSSSDRTSESSPASSVECNALEEPPASPRHSIHKAVPPWESGLDDVSRPVTLLGTDNLHHATSEQTLRSPTRRLQIHAPQSTESLNSLIDSGAPEQRRADGIVQLDDVEFSSDEDDNAVRKALRRLPGARDLRRARRGVEATGQSFAPQEQTHASVVPADFDRGSGFRASSASIPPARLGYLRTELFDPDEALAGYELVRGFNLDGFESDDDEPGDAEAALRKLEGYIDEDKKMDRARKAEALWQKSKLRAQGSQLAQEQPASMSSVVADGKKAFAAAPGHADPDVRAESESDVSVPDISRNIRATTQRASVTALGAPMPLSTGVPAFGLPPMHRCFLMDYRSEDVAKQMSLIEAELFTHISWQELTSGDWRAFRQRNEVSDWEGFYRLRMREKAIAEQNDQTYHDNHLGVIVARFNLAANWVASEILLTQTLRERVALIAKFIRVAWVSSPADACDQNCLLIFASFIFPAEMLRDGQFCLDDANHFRLASAVD